MIDKILGTGHYIVVVPLLVISELDKLSKSVSNYNDDSIEHAEYVQQSAKSAIKYLNEKFENKRERNLKALTSQVDLSLLFLLSTFLFEPFFLN